MRILVLAEAQPAEADHSLKEMQLWEQGYDIILIRENVTAGPLCCRAFVKH